MLTDPPSPADESSGQRQGDSDIDGPSLEEVVDRIKRMRPSEMSSSIQTASDLPVQTIGCYTIRRVVGQGAFGVVYQAYDEQLGRDVAIKVPRPEVLFDESKLRRFESEAATAATLAHPSIIPIYEADLTGPTPYIASAYCVGPNLGEWLANRTDSIPVDQAARFVIKLAEAVHYAHRQGVLHRDLKPTNVMLEPCHKVGIGGNQLEQFEPKLTDFGLAKLLESDLQETRSGIMVGTPKYMAPEQYDKRLGSVGVQSDVYALGAILYELLVGQSANEGSSHMELLVAILERQVTPPSRIRSSVTPTLEAICLKALEKRPKVRYSTALELADDLGRYLRGEPTIAKSLGIASRAAKWVRLNPLAASLLAVVSVSIIGLVLGVTWHDRSLSGQLAVSDRLRVESAENASQSDRLRIKALRASYVSDMQLTQQAISGGRFSEARSRLAKFQPESDGAKVSDFAWFLLNDQLSKTLVDFEFRGPLRTLATSDVLKVSATGGEDGMLRFFDLATGVELAIAKAHDGNVNAIAFAADETTLVSGGDDGMLCVWETTALCEGGKIELISSRKAHENDLLCLAVAPNSKWIATGSADNTVRLWNYKGLEPSGELLGHTDWVRALDFSPDSASLASGSHDSTVRRWDLETRKEVDRFFADHLIEQKECVYCLKHHPTEPLIIAGYKDYAIRFWDISTGKQRRRIDLFNGWVRSLSFSSDGNQIAASADDSRVMVLEKGTDGRYEQSKVAFTDRYKNSGIAFANSDSQLVSVGTAGGSIWSTVDNLAGETICKLPHSVHCMACPADENSLVLTTHWGIFSVSLEDSATEKYQVVSHYAAVTNDGSLIVSVLHTAVENIYVRLCDRRKKTALRLYSGSGHFSGIDISPSGKFVAAAMPDLTIRIWQAPDFQQETIVDSPFETDIDDLYINDTGTQLFLRPDIGHEMTVLDVATSKPVAVLQNVKRVLNRSADGRLLAISRPDCSVTIYDSQSHQAVKTLPSHANKVTAACFSPTEPLLATITSEDEITLWALDTGEVLIRFQAAFTKKRNHKVYLAITPDGRALVAGGVHKKETGYGSEFRIWRVP